MPIVWDEATFRAMYVSSGTNEDNEPHTYGRAYFAQPSMDNTFEDRADRLIAVGVAGHVLVVGAAFGYLCEALQAKGIDATGVDSSPFIAAFPEEATGLVRQLDVRDDQGSYDWVVTESVLESYEDPAEIIAACHRLAPRVVHIIFDDLAAPFTNHAQSVDPDAVWVTL